MQRLYKCQTIGQIAELQCSRLNKNVLTPFLSTSSILTSSTFNIYCFKVTFNPNVRTRCVTLDGDSFDPAGTLTGGNIYRILMLKGHLGQLII